MFLCCIGKQHSPRYTSAAGSRSAGIIIICGVCVAAGLDLSSPRSEAPHHHHLSGTMPITGEIPEGQYTATVYAAIKENRFDEAVHLLTSELGVSHSCSYSPLRCGLYLSKCVGHAGWEVEVCKSPRKC